MDRKIDATSSTRSYRHALVLVPALTVLVLGILWVTILLRLQIEKSAVMRDTRVAALTLADALETHTLKTVHDVDEIALLVKYGYERTPETFNLAAYRGYGLITADTALQVTLAGADGRVIASTLPFSGTIDLRDREHFRVHLGPADIGLFISQPVLGRISKQQSVQATRRINLPNGGFGGVVIVSEDPAYLTDGFYNNAALGARGMIAVLSDRGFMLSRRAGNSPSRAGEVLPASYVNLSTTAVADFFDPVDHVERVVASRHLKKYGLTVVVGLSVDEALEDYLRMRRVYVIMALTISVMLAALSTWITALIFKLLKGKEELRLLSQTDRLTHLPNRGKIVDVLDEAIAAPDAVGKVAVIFVDLDNFKHFNDTYGHQCGDEILVTVATRLITTVRTHDVVGRLGGDEFLIVLRAATPTGAVEQVVAELTAALRVPMNLRWGVEAVSASFGIAVLKAGENSSELIRKADLAMYRAKNGERSAQTAPDIARLCAGR